MSKFTYASDEELIERIGKIRKREGRDDTDTLLCLLEVKRRKLHLESGYRSIYKFLQLRFGYSSKQSYLRTRAAEALAIEPSVEFALRDNRVTMTQLAEAVTAIYREGVRLRNLGQPSVQLTERRALLIEIVAKGESQKTIARHFPELVDDHTIEHPITQELTQLSMAVTQHELQLIERVRELLSSKIVDGNWHDVALELVEFFLKKKDFLGRKPRKPIATVSSNQRGHFSLATIQALFMRSRGRCEFVSPSTNVRCEARTQLQVDHILPVAHGGTDEFGNLRLLCAEHNRFAAFEKGLDFFP